MRIFGRIEERASREPDCVSRLRYLRGVRARRVQRVRFARVALAVLVMAGGSSLGRSKGTGVVSPKLEPTRTDAKTPASVWMVEQTPTATLYSNGLTVRREYEAESLPRRYRVYRRESLARSEERHAPVGIVFHTSESLILPLEAGQNKGLLRTRIDVLDHARRGRLYNFLIDRFGQVSRVVPEEQTAFHAGHSIWASGDSVWVDLNESFLAVSFEAESNGIFEPSAAQVHAGRLLTEVLRSQFAIPEENCVTHAQVSVNPDNMRIGYHTDWGSAFPFRALGLQDNYTLPVASVAVFGFRHDDTFLHAIGDRAWSGLRSAEAAIAARASREGLTPEEFAAHLQQLYKELRRQRHG